MNEGWTSVLITDNHWGRIWNLKFQSGTPVRLLRGVRLQYLTCILQAIILHTLN